MKPVLLTGTHYSFCLPRAILPLLWCTLGLMWDWVGSRRARLDRYFGLWWKIRIYGELAILRVGAVLEG